MQKAEGHRQVPVTFSETWSTASSMFVQAFFAYFCELCVKLFRFSLCLGGKFLLSSFSRAQLLIALCVFPPIPLEPPSQFFFSLFQLVIIDQPAFQCFEECSRSCVVREFVVTLGVGAVGIGRK